MQYNTHGDDVKKGFTLAEVLITLAIIGVVAALTLPNLIMNYKKVVYVNQLKKSISVVENGLKLAMAEDEVDKLFNTSLYNSANTVGDVPIENLKKYFNIVDYKDRSYVWSYYWYNGDNCIYLNGNECQDDMPPNNVLFMVDGQIIIFRFEESSQPMVAIDTNGSKKPNQLGRDLFIFYLNDDGTLNSDYDSSHNDCVSTGRGINCGQYLIQNSYKMDY